MIKSYYSNTLMSMEYCKNKLLAVAEPDDIKQFLRYFTQLLHSGVFPHYYNLINQVTFLRPRVTSVSFFLSRASCKNGGNHVRKMIQSTSNLSLIVV